jgi:glycerate 2-kinase
VRVLIFWKFILTMEKSLKRILIASDSFKDCLSSEHVGRFLKEGMEELLPEAEIIVFPVADGGEGTASCINFHRGGKWKRALVRDPLSRPFSAEYLVLENENTAIIELARASGLELLSAAERDALNTTTYGTGELIKDALDAGIKKIILTIGGSATVDGGTGIASALGFMFTDRGGKKIEPMTGGRLKNISRIHSCDIHPLFSEAEIEIACDVQNFLNGEEGAARIYGPQKGADVIAVARLEEGLKHLSEIIFDDTGFDADKHPGTGAAGGASLFLLAYGKGMLRSGFEIVMQMTGMLDEIERSELVISGEGKIDRQTIYGKVVSSVSSVTGKNKIPFIAVAGKIEGERQIIKEKLGAADLFAVRDHARDDTDSLINAPEYLRKTGKMIAQNLLSGKY